MASSPRSSCFCRSSRPRFVGGFFLSINRCHPPHGPKGITGRTEYDRKISGNRSQEEDFEGTQDTQAGRIRRFIAACVRKTSPGEKCQSCQISALPKSGWDECVKNSPNRRATAAVSVKRCKKIPNCERVAHPTVS
jgi:hypothetical protein